MRYIKTYENLNSPELNDYVICETRLPIEEDLQKFLVSNIGKIVKINYNESEYYVKYINLPDDLWIYCNSDDEIIFRREEIVYWSKNKKDLEIYIDINKYNL